MVQVFYDFSLRHCVIALDFLSHFYFLAHIKTECNIFLNVLIYQVWISQY